MSPAKKGVPKSGASAAKGRRRASRVAAVTDTEPATPMRLSPDKVTKRKYTKRHGSSASSSATARLQNWHFTHVPPNNVERSKNGRQKGRMLVNWNRPRMMEKVLLHLQYETTIRGIGIPWNNIAHRLVPGASGDALLQRMSRLRHELIAEGHLVPPLPGKSGKFTDPMVRGLVRQHPNDPNALLTTREVRFDEPFEDLEFNDPTGYMLVHNGEMEVMEVTKHQSSADSDENDETPFRDRSSRLRDMPHKSMKESSVSGDEVEVDQGEEADDEYDAAATPATPFHKMPFPQNAANSFYGGQRPATPSPIPTCVGTQSPHPSTPRASNGAPSAILPADEGNFGYQKTMWGANAMDANKALQQQQATKLAVHCNYPLLCKAAGIQETDRQKQMEYAEWLMGHPNINSLLLAAGMSQFIAAPLDPPLAADQQDILSTDEHSENSHDPFKLSA